MFEKFSEVAEGKEKEIESCLQNDMISHLQNLYQEFSRYFPDLEVIDLSLVRNPFNVEPGIIPDSDQDEFLEMKFDTGMKEFFQRTFYTGILVTSMYIISYSWEDWIKTFYLLLQLACVSQAFVPYYK